MSDHLDMSELLELFLAEAGEQLQSIDEGLLALEQNPEDLNIVNNIFRAAHTLKGSSATMGFEQIASLTHSMENLFDKFRGGLLPVTAEAIDALLAAVDLLRALVRQALGGDATVIVIDEVLSDLKIVLDGGAGVPAESSSAAIESPVTSPDDCMRIEIRFSTDCDMPQGRAFMVFSFLDGKGEIVSSEPAQDQTDQLKPGSLLTLDFKPCVSKAEILESLDLICEISVTLHDPSNQSSEAPISVSLDDVAALLMQIEAGNLDELARVAQSLRDFVADGSHSSSSRELVSQAVANLEESLAQGQGATDELLSKVGDLLGAAMEEMDTCELELVSTSEPSNSVSSSQNPPQTTEQGDSLPADADVALIGEFVTECGECIQGAEVALLLLESNPEDMEAINTVFRAFHTTKGTSAFLGLPAISELAHRAESLLSRVRDGEIRCTGGYADLALRSADMLKALLHSVQNALSGHPIVRPDGYDDLYGLLADPEAAGVTSGGASTPPRLGDILVSQGKAKREDVEAAVAVQGRKSAGESQVKSGASTGASVAKALRTQKPPAATEHATEDSSVRVRTDRLDRLIDTVGELVIAQSMVAQDDIVVLGGHHALSKKVVHLGKIVRDLQTLSMSMRMVPLKLTFQKMARMVRDLAQKNGKQITFVTEGEDTEIDRNMVDLVNDPLVHMVRNAVDHGVEAPDVRESCGKPKKGTVKISAYYSGGNVVVEMQDDGKGLNRERIVEKAIQKGLISSDKGMSDTDVYNLIFAPGFSTADQITEISGRGVGLDVVKRNIEALRGRVEVSSEPGQGCSFLLRLPLTMAVTDGMLVKVGTQQFIVPTINIRLSFRPEPAALSTVIGQGEMVMLREELMPIFRLHELFGIDDAKQNPLTALLVVVDDGERSCALLVDEILGQQHVVARSLGNGIGTVQGVSGGAILGDGRVGLILDPVGVVALARQQCASHRRQEVEILNVA